MADISDYQSALAFIHGRPRFQKRPDLVRMKTFLKSLANPEKGLSYIHVTGTNGKGSVVAMTQSILSAHGLRVGTFTSPFITRFNERIAIDGQPISDSDLTRLTRKVAPLAEKQDQTCEFGGPTEFDLDTALAFLYFQEKQPDVVILEVGIGGLYDSTNVIEDPAVTAITTVGWDHMKLLGNTLGKIATQKAGIMKKGRPCVVGSLPAEAMRVVELKAKDLGANLYVAGRDFGSHKTNEGQLQATIRYDGLSIHHGLYRLGLLGDYQVANAAVAITVSQLFLQSANIPLDRSAVKNGLAECRWPGRVELVNEKPAVILDGAHNLPGMQALAKTIRQDLKGREVYVIVAILADKQYQLMLGELAAIANVHLILTNFTGPSKNRPSADLAGVMKDIPTHYPVQTEPNWQLAIAKAAQEADENDAILITGSLYFISDVRQLFQN